MLIIGTLLVAAVIAYALVYVLEIEWFKERLLSPDRWTRAVGMLPIIVPLYIAVAAMWLIHDRRF